MLSIWFGNEPYLMKNEIDRKYTETECPEMNFFRGELNDTNYSACFMGAMFAEQRVLILSSAIKNPLLEALVDSDTDNDISVIITDDIDRRLSVYKKAEKKKLLREFGRLGTKEFDSFCRELLANTVISQEAYGYLLRRMAYGKRENCDLYTIKAWLGQISSAPQLDEKLIDHIIPEYTEDDVFRLFSLLAAKDGGQYFRLLDSLLEGDPKSGINILSVLLRNFRIAYKAAVAGNSAEKELAIPAWQLRPMRGIDMEAAKGCMTLLQESVNRIKTGYPQRSAVSETSCRILSILRG